MKCATFFLLIFLFANLVHASSSDFAKRASKALNLTPAKLELILDEVINIDEDRKVIDQSHLIAVGKQLDVDDLGHALREAYMLRLNDGVESRGLIMLYPGMTKLLILGSSGTIVTKAAVNGNFAEIPQALSELQASLEKSFPEMEFQPLEMLGLLNFGVRPGFTITTERSQEFSATIRSHSRVDRRSTGFGFLPVEGAYKGELLQAPLLDVTKVEIASISGRSRLSQILLKRQLISQPLMWRFKESSKRCESIFFN